MIDTAGRCRLLSGASSAPYRLVSSTGWDRSDWGIWAFRSGCAPKPKFFKILYGFAAMLFSLVIFLTLGTKHLANPVTSLMGSAYHSDVISHRWAIHNNPVNRVSNRWTGLESLATGESPRGEVKSEALETGFEGAAGKTARLIKSQSTLLHQRIPHTCV